MALKPKRKRRASSKASAAPVEPRTEGQRRLLAVSGSHAAVAAAIGTTKQSVSEWRRGLKTPSAEVRAKLAAKYGIEPAAWSVAAAAEAPALSADAPASPEAAAPLPELAGEHEHLRELLRDLRTLRANPQLTPSERARTSGEELKALRRIAELEARRELSEARYVDEHPRWQELLSEILVALEPFPEAYAAVVVATMPRTS